MCGYRFRAPVLTVKVFVTISVKISYTILQKMCTSSSVRVKFPCVKGVLEASVGRLRGRPASRACLAAVDLSPPCTFFGTTQIY